MAKKTAARKAPQKGAEPIKDIQPQEQEAKPATGQQGAPTVEGKQARSGEPKGSGDSGGAKSLQGGGNSQGTGVESEELRDGLFPASLHPKKEAFLRGYVESGGRISEACKAASCSRWAHYYWLEQDPEYAALFERMKARALDTLRDEIVRRGVHGIDEAQFYQGVQVGTVKRYSDNLLMFETKRHDPLYRDNPQLALGLKAAGDIKISLSIPRPDEPGEIVDAEAREIPGK